MLPKLASLLINLCVNDQRNLIHSLKNNHPGALEKVGCLFILEKLMNKTSFSGEKEVKWKFSEFIHTGVPVIVWVTHKYFHRRGVLEEISFSSERRNMSCIWLCSSSWNGKLLDVNAAYLSKCCSAEFSNSRGTLQRVLYSEYWKREKREHLYETWPVYLKHRRRRNRMDERVMLVLRQSMSSAITLTQLS